MEIDVSDAMSKYIPEPSICDGILEVLRIERIRRKQENEKKRRLLRMRCSFCDKNFIEATTENTEITVIRHGSISLKALCPKCGLFTYNSYDMEWRPD